MPRKDAYPGGSISAQAQQDLMSEGIENFELPKSVVTKIAKSAIPDNVKLQKETVLSLVKGSTVFINYLAATAHDVAHTRQHKSISASDVLRAVEILGFHDLSSKLQADLTVYRETTKNDPKAVKKSNGSASASVKKTGSTAGTSASAKSKGKEKVVATNPYPPPFTSVPLEASRAGGSISAPPVSEEDMEGNNQETVEPSQNDVDDPMDYEPDAENQMDEDRPGDRNLSDDEKELAGKGLEEPGTSVKPSGAD